MIYKIVTWPSVHQMLEFYDELFWNMLEKVLIYFVFKSSFNLY